MHAVVCIKQVPDTTDVKVNPETGTLIRDGVPSITNPFDTYAIEEALRLKDAHGCKVTVLTMGPQQAKEILREALAMGADEALLVSDRAFAGSDTWATAYTLSQAIRQLGDVDIILCGKQAIDGDTGQTGPGIAMQLGIRQLTYVFRIQNIDLDAKTIAVERLLEEGREVVTSALPALVTVVKDINQPRYATMKGILRSRKAEIPVWTVDSLGGVDRKYLGLDGSPTRVLKVFNPPARSGEITWINGESNQELASNLAEAIIKEQII